MKTRKGFTIIEILAVIVIMAIVMVIAVPAIFKITKKSSENLYCSKLEIVQKSAERYADDNSLVDTCEINGEEYNCEAITIQDLINDNYIDSDGLDGAFIDPRDKSSINTMEVLVYSKNSRSYAYVNDSVCPSLVTSALSPTALTNVKHTVTFVLGGGTWSGTNPTILRENATLYVNDPVKAGSLFTGWSRSNESSTLENKTLKMGTEDLVLTANWNLIGYVFTVLTDGGTWSGITPQLLQTGDTVTVNKPVKAGSLFTGWTITGGGSFTDETTFTIGTSDTTLTANWQPYSSMFSYVVGGSPGVEGTDYVIVDNGDSTNWKIKFLKSGTFTPAINMIIDVFLVGGGGGGTAAYSTCGAGGGGYTTTAVRKVLTASTGYPIVVGAGVTSGQGGTSSAFSVSALGGYSGGSSTGGNGGSGGAATSSATYVGGSDGSYGDGNSPGTGQRTTTREFGEVDGALYAGGGGANRGGTGLGGAGGGGSSGTYNSIAAQPGTPNTGGGGGSQLTASSTGGGKSGGSGIVVIRNTKINTVGDTSKFIFAYSGSYEIINASTDSWKVKFLTSGTFIPLSTASIDAFLVGGGGGGAGYVSACSVAGGGGKTLTTSLTINSGTEYLIVVGLGGRGGAAGGAGSAGAATTAFSYSAAAGGAGTSTSGGSGGSGGARTGSSSFNGGTNGSNGLGSTPGTGQGTTTREFGEVTGDLYSAGGGATRSTGQGLAGDDSGGNGGNLTTHPGGYDAPANRGGGGGGSSNASYTGGAGGSGVVVIRRHP